MTEERGFVPGGSRAHRTAWWWHALAALFFLVCALWAVRVIIPAPASTFPFPARADANWRPIIQSDQKLSAANITWNAHRFLTRPWELYEPGQCYPARHAATLGPHQLGEGLLGILPYVLTRDPVITYNTVVVLTLWLPALTMYALVFAFTRSAAAAFIAGLLFAFHPQRIIDVIHPDVHGNHWTPLALLFAHRTFAYGRWRDAVALALFLALQVLGSVYPLLALGALGGTYGLFLAARYARRLPSLAPKLAVAIGVTALVAWLVLGPYLETRATWGAGALRGRATLFFDLRDFSLGGPAYPGSILLVLAAIALADRWRGRRERAVDDPRLVFLVGGLIVLWSAVWAIPIPGLGIRVPSLFMLAGRVLPGLDAVRAGAAIGFGTVLAGAFLAGYGVAALVEQRSAALRAAVTIVLTVAILAEVFHPTAATYSYGTSAEMRSYAVRPPQSVLELYTNSGDGAVLDVPFGFSIGRFIDMADGVFLGAFHLRPVGACYNSFKLPLHDDIQEMAERLGTDPRAADTLHALGFDTLMVNEFRVRGMNKYLRIAIQPDRFPPIGHAVTHSAYRLASSAPVVTSLAVLAVSGASTAVRAATAPESSLAFTFRNGSGATFRHPEPIEPTRVRIRWYGGAAVVREDDVAMLLPIALAAEEESTRTITVPVPPAGNYEVTLSPVATPDLILARHAVQVTEAAAPNLARSNEQGADVRARLEPPR